MRMLVSSLATLVLFATSVEAVSLSWCTHARHPVSWEIQAEHAIVLRDQGLGYANQGDLGTAIALYDGSVRLNPCDPVTFERRAIAYALIDRNNRDLARADAWTAILLDDHPGRYVVLAMIDMLRKDWRSAEAALRFPARLMPENPEVKVALAMLVEGMQDALSRKPSHIEVVQRE